MKKYLVAFDMSPLVTGGKDYIQMIIAERNKEWWPGKYVAPRPAEHDSDSDKTEDEDDRVDIDTSKTDEGE